MIETFEDTGIRLVEGDAKATRKQLQILYGVPKTTLTENIQALKSDGLIVGSEIRPKSGRPYELYNLDEIISVGFRLRSEKAIKFQKWARNILINEIKILNEKLKIQKAQFDRFWDQDDIKNLYGR